MFSMIQKQKNKRLQQELEKRIAFRRNLSSLEAGEKRLMKAAAEQRQNAVAAEKNGDHASAVRCALEAQRLEKQVRATGDMKNKTMTVHALSENTRALTGMMKAVNETAGSSGMPDAAEIISMQVEMEAIRENTDMLMDVSRETLDQLSESMDPANDDTGEAALRELMKAEEKKKHRSLLMETGKKLDTVTRNRAME